MERCNKATVFSLPCQQIVLGDVKVSIVCVCVCVCVCARAYVCMSMSVTVTCTTRYEAIVDGLQHRQSQFVSVCGQPYPTGM